MQKFRNGDGSYTVSHPVAMSLFLALETEQRNKNYIIAQNEYQMTHMRNIMESANFAVQIRDEVSANITKHISTNSVLRWRTHRSKSKSTRKLFCEDLVIMKPSSTIRRIIG